MQQYQHQEGPGPSKAKEGQAFQLGLHSKIVSLSTACLAAVVWLVVVGQVSEIWQVESVDWVAP